MESYKIMVKGILKCKDKYLIVQKWFDDSINNPFQWCFIDGKLQYPESPDRGVLRLIEEHTGLLAEIDHLLYTWTYMVGDTCNVGISYLCTTESDQVILSEELSDYRWVNKDEFDAYITNENILQDVKSADL